MLIPFIESNPNKYVVVPYYVSKTSLRPKPLPKEYIYDANVRKFRINGLVW